MRSRTFAAAAAESHYGIEERQLSPQVMAGPVLSRSQVEQFQLLAD
jgi:hypothetical protein